MDLLKKHSLKFAYELITESLWEAQDNFISVTTARSSKKLNSLDHKVLEQKMKKQNFIISNNRNLWIENSADLFIVEPYIYHILEQNKELHKYDKITVAPFRRQSCADLIYDSNYIDRKYEKYVPILAERLNHIHGLKHSKSFWKKSLSLAFVRYIITFHDIFTKCESYFNQNEHMCNILSKESYYVPLDFEDYRKWFQGSNYGAEQLLSIYMNLFYPGNFSEIYSNYDRKLGTNSVNQKSQRLSKKKSGILFGNIKSISFRDFLNKLYLLSGIPMYRIERANKKIKLGIMECYFSMEKLNELIVKSHGRINLLEWRTSWNYEDKKKLWDKRLLLAQYENDFDNFDKFFFSSIPYCFPRVFVEHYNEIKNSYKMQFKKYPKLNYVISEGWISNTYVSIFLALLQEQHIKHITNEHNGIMHPYAGSYISHVIDMSDIFVTLGWSDPKIPKLVKGASLYPFNSNKEYKKKIYTILYIASPAIVKMSHYLSAWGQEEENATKHLKFVETFFNNLDYTTLQKITYRSYPNKYIESFLAYNKEYILRYYLERIQSFADTSESSKDQMKQSKLVIVDYLSTSYLESLSMNIPTVFFWNADTYYLNDEYSDFFDPLVDAKICQTDPLEAARFVESIADEPEKWWFSEEVQKGRNEFLNRNLGKPEDMIKYLLNLTDTR